MQRTDLTCDLDAALSRRNEGAQHFSQVARGGNGQMLSDLVEEDKDYEELAGIGETQEQLKRDESRLVDSLGAAAPFKQFRRPALGEIPPYTAPSGKAWLRKREVTSGRIPGGNRIARVKWVLASNERAGLLAQAGQLSGVDAFPGGMAGIAALGLAAFFLFAPAAKR